MVLLHKLSAPLLRAIRKGKETEVVKALIESSGGDTTEQRREYVMTSDYRGWTALHVATLKNDVALMTVLVSFGADLNARTKELSTPLCVAAYNGKVEAAQWLLVQGADPFLTDEQGRTPRDIALLQRKAKVAALLAPP